MQQVAPSAPVMTPESGDTKSATRALVGQLLVRAQALHDERRLTGPSKAFLKELVLGRNPAALELGRRILAAPTAAAEAPLLQELQGLVEERARAAYDALFEACDLTLAHQLASKDVDELIEEGTDVRSLVYGEVSFGAFYEVLQAAVADRPKLGKFYDLGSGTGRAVFAAVVAVDCDVFVGIEMLPRLHAAACEVADRYVTVVEPLLAAPPLVRLYNGDVTAGEFDWSDGDLVFANSTCFDQELLREIAAIAERLKPGARIITFTMALSTLWLRVVYKKKFTMSWGPATVYIHQKLSEEEYAARLQAWHCEYDDDQGVIYEEPASVSGDLGAVRGSGSKSGHATYSDTDSLLCQAPSYAASSTEGDELIYQRALEVDEMQRFEEEKGDEGEEEADAEEEDDDEEDDEEEDDEEEDDDDDDEEDGSEEDDPKANGC